MNNRTKVVDQVRAILNEVSGEDEIIAIEKVVQEARGKIPPEAATGFWVDKRPCWEMCQCPEMIKSECPAPKFQSVPCWEIEGTYCKLDDYGSRGDDTSICAVCRVFKRWGENKPIKMTLCGKGINTSVKALEAVAKQW